MQEEFQGIQWVGLGGSGMIREVQLRVRKGRILWDVCVVEDNWVVWEFYIWSLVDVNRIRYDRVSVLVKVGFDIFILLCVFWFGVGDEDSFCSFSLVIFG